jgi:nucleoid-associated protein YgaU
MNGAERKTRRATATSDFLIVVVAVAVVVGAGFTINKASDIDRLGSGTVWRSFDDLWKRSSATVARAYRTTWSAVPAHWASLWKSSGTGDHMSYTVRRGDTLARIAETHGVALSALVSFNRIEDADKLEVSQMLLIPPPEVSAGNAMGGRGSTRSHPRR